MNKLNVTVAGLLICFCLPVAIAQAATPQLGLASADWSLKQARTLNAVPRSVVWKFMNGGNSDNGSPGSGKVCEYRFADLRHSGTLSLVVSYDNGGTADCNNVEVIDKVPAGFEYFDFDTTQDFSFDSVQDINGDGRSELVVRGGVAGGGVDHCTATWPIVYAWTGSGYSDVSSHYKNFYERQLAPLQKEIAADGAQSEQSGDGSGSQDSQSTASAVTTPSQSEEIPSYSTSPIAQISPVRVLPQIPPKAPVSPLESSELSCTKAEAAKIERFLGISHDAGMSDAIKWAESDDPATRQFASIILSDIGPREAVEYQIARGAANDSRRTPC
jgi:uncharacterized repeat protein (TIGR01451 family)